MKNDEAYTLKCVRFIVKTLDDLDHAYSHEDDVFKRHIKLTELCTYLNISNPSSTPASMPMVSPPGQDNGGSIISSGNNHESSNSTPDKKPKASNFR